MLMIVKTKVVELCIGKCRDLSELASAMDLPFVGVLTFPCFLE
jgi:hypothetical protein